MSKIDEIRARHQSVECKTFDYSMRDVLELAHADRAYLLERVAKLAGKVDWVYSGLSSLAEELYQQGDDKYGQWAASLACDLLTANIDPPARQKEEGR